jgi:CRISPR-associated protein Csb2
MAFAIGIRFLTGYCTAAVAPGGPHEWPPHLARVFMAMAAAHFETGEDPTEREALEWLERDLPAPAIVACEGGPRSRVVAHVPANDTQISQALRRKLGRRTGEPSQDEITSGLQLLPDRRPRKERTFARVWLSDEVVYFVWQQPHAREHELALDQLCRKVTRIGHPSSLVQVWVAEASDVPTPNWVPDDDQPTLHLRSVTPGLLRHLKDQFGDERRARREETEARLGSAQAAIGSLQGRGNRGERARLQDEVRALKLHLSSLPSGERFRPTIGIWQGYARPKPKAQTSIRGTVWDPSLIVLNLTPQESWFRRLELTSTIQLTNRVREVVIHQAHRLSCGCERWKNGVPTPTEARECWRRIPEWVSGHKPDGTPSELPHLAYLPLAFVGHEHADGHVLGLGLAVPSTTNRKEHRYLWSVLSAVAEHGLKLGPLGVWRVTPEDRELPPINLRGLTWTAAERGAKQWATVTPIAFDQHPKSRDRAERCRERPNFEAELAEMIRRAWARISPQEGLPPHVAQVVTTSVSAHLGVPASHQFPRLKRKDGTERRHLHAILTFSEPLRGPVTLGAGRYRGYGFCRPLSD